jgi:hypothetical protein
MTELREDTPVRVSGKRGTIHATIQRIAHPDALPLLPDIPADLSKEFSQIMQEWGVTRVALIAYPAAVYPEPGGFDLMFAAIEVDGKWWDMQHQLLEITSR